MKIIKKNVYYCEFCNKKSLAAHATSSHEKHCTANPNRHCRICEMSTTIQDEVNEYKSRFTLQKNEQTQDIFSDKFFNTDEYIVRWVDKPVTIDELRERFDDCPACILSILRQTGMNKHYFHFEFDFKQEMQEAFDEKIRRENEMRSQNYCY